MRGVEFGALTAFVAVADHGNFSKAAAALGVSASTMSQTIRSLEERLGIRLLNRTTRSVALTEAGDRLLQRIHPALDEIGNAVESLAAFSDTPAGVLRLSVGSIAVRMVIDPLLPSFRASYPDITLDIVVDDSQVDIVDGHFDAGIRLGTRIEHDMIVLRVSQESRLIAVASPAYLMRHGRPGMPADLSAHDCIQFRHTTGAMQKWEFENDDETIDVATEGSLITNDLDLVVRAALNGVGIGYVLEEYVATHLAEGRLVAVLNEWSLPFAGYHLFYPSRRQMPPKLKAFIDFLRAGAHKNIRPRLRAITDAA